MTSHQQTPERVELTDNPDRPIAVYDTPVIMVGGGVVDLEQLKHLAQQYPLIAVDSGSIALDNAGLTPELLVGDFDSVRPTARDGIPHQIKISDQCTTDFQKALAVVDAPKIFGLGFLGGRMDHSLATMHAMADHHHRDIVLVDPHDIAVMVKGDFSAVLPQGIRLSIWSMLPQRFKKSKGLVWPLEGLEIGAGKTLGTSNQVVMPDAMPVDPERGGVDVMITTEKAHPFMVMVEPSALAAFID